MSRGKVLWDLHRFAIAASVVEVMTAITPRPFALLRIFSGACNMTVPHHHIRRSVANGSCSVARRFAAFAAELKCAMLPAEVVAKAKTCLLDLLSCAIEARVLPWGIQAAAFATAQGGERSTIIAAHGRANPSDAAFANATMAHGLIREDMHTPSTSHLGVVVWPSLLALAELRPMPGSDLLAGAVAGYELGGRLGRVLVDREVAQRFRPTGLVGAITGATAGARLVGLSEDAAVSAIALAANTAGGLNEWPRAGGSEVFFHAGFAARNAVTAVELAGLGMCASETSIEGQAGLLAAFDRAERARDVAPLADGRFEIMAVYNKPAPACNYVQTACQAALEIVAGTRVRACHIRAVHVSLFPEAIAYPGCDHAGPFDTLLQAKMSIQFSVAAVLVRAALEEENYVTLDDPEILRLAAATTLGSDDAFARAYPNRQGSEVEVVLADGTTRSHRLDDVIACAPDGVRKRFQKAAGAAFGDGRAHRIEDSIERLESMRDAGQLAAMLSAAEWSPPSM
jgi:2-methylcitrate dehydratase PrpD